MNSQDDLSKYKACEKAFTLSILETIQAILEQQDEARPINKEKLLHELAFAVSAHISGSSYGGEVSGHEVYPRLGYALGETDEKVYFGDGSSMHEIMASFLAERASDK